MVDMGKLFTLLKSENESGWQSALFSLAHSQGFDQVLFGAVGSKHAKLENAFLHSNYSAAWRQRYDADRLAYVDPTVAHCLSSSLPIVWEPDTFRCVQTLQRHKSSVECIVSDGTTFYSSSIDARIKVFGPKEMASTS